MLPICRLSCTASLLLSKGKREWAFSAGREAARALLLWVSYVSYAKSTIWQRCTNLPLQGRSYGREHYYRWHWYHEDRTKRSSIAPSELWDQGQRGSLICKQTFIPQDASKYIRPHKLLLPRPLNVTVALFKGTIRDNLDPFGEPGPTAASATTLLMCSRRIHWHWMPCRPYPCTYAVALITNVSAWLTGAFNSWVMGGIKYCALIFWGWCIFNRPCPPIRWVWGREGHRDLKHQGLFRRYKFLTGTKAAHRFGPSFVEE